MSGRAGAADAQVRGIAGPRRLVRALLFWTISSPVLFALFPLGGCVLPVGPEFQDPPEEDNQVPYFVAPPGGVDGPPFYEQTVTISGTQMFVVKVADANLGDDLTVRWLANYPPGTKATKLLDELSVDRNGMLTGTSTKYFNCADFAGGADQDLVVILSDNGFAQSADVAINPMTALNQAPYNFDSSLVFVPTMIGWRIAGCQQ